MENEELVEQETLNPEGDSDTSTTEAEVDLDKADELVKNYQIRLDKANKLKAEAEKVEKEFKQLKSQQPKEVEVPKTSNNVSLSDLAAITAAKIHPDDIERVEKFAKDEGLTLREALKNEELKAILGVREEHRNTAQATNTGGGKRGTSKVTGEDLLEKFNQGQVPEKDEDMVKMIEERFTPKPKA